MCSSLKNIDPLSHLHVASMTLNPIQGSLCGLVYRFSNGNITEHFDCLFSSNMKTYFVVYGSFYQSWVDMKNMCTLLGATMPSVISRWHSDLLGTLLLRSSQLSSQNHYPRTLPTLRSSLRHIYRLQQHQGKYKFQTGWHNNSDIIQYFIY